MSEPVYCRPRNHAYGCGCSKCRNATQYGREMMNYHGCLVAVVVVLMLVGGAFAAVVPSADRPWVVLSIAGGSWCSVPSWYSR